MASVAPAEAFHSEADDSKKDGHGTVRRRSLGGGLVLVIPEKQGPFKRNMVVWSSRLRPLLESLIFRVTLVACLIFALFGGGLFVVLDVPDDPGILVLDTLMAAVTILFLIEMVVNGIVDYKTYPLSFFFWMDALGTASMIFEISTLLGSFGKMQTANGSVDAMLMRTARAAKVGARVGRLSKLMKCLSYYLRDKDKNMDMSSNPAEAKKLSTRLMMTLSTKVSFLTILLVLAVPLFTIGQYPEQDLSMLLWAKRLETEYKRAYDELTGLPPGSTSTQFQDSVEEMKEFYTMVNYFVYDLDGFEQEVMVNGNVSYIPGVAQLSDLPGVVQMSDIYRVSVPACLVERPECPGDAHLYFNFHSPRRIEVTEDMALAFFIILLMIGVSTNLNQTLHKLVVQPMESMLSVVKDNAAQLLKQFGLEDDMDQGEEDVEETELLEGIFKKFARLASLAAGRNEATAEELAGMDESARGVMMDMMNVQVAPASTSDAAASSSLRNSGVSHPNTGSEGLEAGEMSAMLDLPDVPVVSSMPVARDTVESWELDVLSMDTDAQTKVALHIFFDSLVGRTTGRYWTEAATFKRFHSVVKAGYNDLPYHNYSHACDVLHTVYRLLCLSASSKWLGSVDQYALLVAALCHDIGHAGRTNPFLVELGDELALRYNDKSPLENMHCAKLFEIASKEESDVFKQMDKDTKKQARRVCIASILHTDNANHFDMVREISKIYELTSEVCNAQARHPDLLPQYVEQVMQKNCMQWVELFLHFADVSNPLKPFDICKKWAWRVLDEFFEQGDEEKRLSLPVGMLNDRDKINRPGSQHGFIQFLVAPLVYTTVKIFPELHPVYSQMAENLDQWKKIWVEETSPSDEDIAKKEADVAKIKDQAIELETRVL
ncbi:Pde9a [Symbiodinium microadriaticum]|nr:Pde9a [Symbiodinium sp. KB8]CAE7276893.1 Pde9a [Symbiodinium microadriaticum]